MDCISCSGNSKQRRDMLKIETDKLGEALPFDYGKISQLRILKATCNYLKKEKYFSNLRNVCVTDQKDEIMNFEETIENEVIFIYLYELSSHLKDNKDFYDRLNNFILKFRASLAF